ncbi:MAG TPA: tetratricopeptide repeat protein [Gammaproteobacteria bacterium]|nr:tetratricopeptide repeat protein [Gammaproteobacteria bacterium]
MDEYLSDREQAERLKKWWRENYRAIVAGIVIALLLIGGWRYWQHRVQARSAAAATLFKQMDEALTGNKGADAVKLGSQLIDDYSDTPFAAQAALALARYDVGSGKPDAAMQQLDWAIGHSRDESLVLLAKLRLARVKLAVGDAQAAIATLDVKDEGGFAAAFADLRGDAYLKLGQTDKARAAYRQALAKWSEEMGDKSLVQMKLDSLPAVGTAKAAAGAKKP